MRPNHYRVYSQVDKACGAAWAPASKAMRSTASSSTRIDGDTLYVNLFIPSTLDWRERACSMTQSTRFPDEDTTPSDGRGNRAFTMKIRYPGLGRRRAHAHQAVNGKPLAASAGPAATSACAATGASGDRSSPPADDDHAGADARPVQLLRGAARSDRAGCEDRSGRREAELAGRRLAHGPHRPGAGMPEESAPVLCQRHRTSWALQAGAGPAADVHRARPGPGARTRPDLQPSSPSSACTIRATWSTGRIRRRPTWRPCSARPRSGAKRSAWRSTRNDHRSGGAR
jgi:hypothetical protein